MGSVGSIGSKGSKGRDNSGKIYFDPEADKDKSIDLYIKEDELNEKIRDLIDINETIVEIRIYKHPLNWWWTIEKNTEGVTIQRCKYIEYIREKYRRTNRPNRVDLIKKASGNGTVLDLIRFVYKKNLLGSKYHLLENNCQTFASILFNNCNSNGALWYPQNRKNML
ncbi:unnamed protein product [Brachionus calyciflorus]|uniref:LRAT domain-containing protein n=1 Tax=Brachionus calyciflorus TaxID=104777 RepID=A0A814PM77_9BILA|nr:unnamed protein product [Brachionus calyciflorus]